MAAKLPISSDPYHLRDAFIGRLDDLQRLMDILLSPSARLVTVVGGGGVGKTRLVTELIEKLEGGYQQGIYFVPLTQLSSANELLPAIAAELDIQSPPNGDFKQALLEHISTWQALFILDNFEPILEGGMLVHEMLSAAPHLKVIATSREKLNLEHEVIYRLKGLDLSSPKGVEPPEPCEAVRLFLQKSRQVRPGFQLDQGNVDAIQQLCQFVDGNPLGILLSAAWIEHFSPAEIMEQVKKNAEFLSRTARDMDPRHSSMRAVFLPSFERLTNRQKEVFRKLAYFRGGFRLEAAQAAAEADLQDLIALVERSLLTRDPDTGRYDLHGLLQQFADEQLTAAGEARSTLSAYAAYYRGLVQERERRLIGPDQNETLDEIQADFDNIRHAFSISALHKDYDEVRAMLPGLYKFCDMRSRAYEAEMLFRLARDGLAPARGETPHPAWALALLCWYDMRAYGKPFERIHEIPVWARACLKAAESIHDPQAMAASLVLLGAFEEDGQKFGTAIRHYQKARQVFAALDDQFWINIRIGLCHLSLKDYPQAIHAFQVSYRRGVDAGERLKQGWSLANIGDVLLEQSKPEEARAYLEQACGHFHAIGNKFGFMWAHFSLARSAIALGHPEEALRQVEIAGELARRLHASMWIAKAEALLQELKADNSRVAMSTSLENGESLSQRELEILQLLKSDLSGPEMAEKLIVSLNTVRFHTKNIYGKLGVNSRLEAIRRAQELGL